jgi:hypothetical protein
MEVVRHDNEGMKQIRIAPVVLQDFQHQFRPSRMTKEGLPPNRLRADKVGLSVTSDRFSGWTHAFPQRLKPLTLFV